MRANATEERDPNMRPKGLVSSTNAETLRLVLVLTEYECLSFTLRCQARSHRGERVLQMSGTKLLGSRNIESHRGPEGGRQM